MHGAETGISPAKFPRAGLPLWIFTPRKRGRQEEIYMLPRGGLIWGEGVRTWHWSYSGMLGVIMGVWVANWWSSGTTIRKQFDNGWTERYYALGTKMHMYICIHICTQVLERKTHICIPSSTQYVYWKTKLISNWTLDFSSALSNHLTSKNWASLVVWWPSGVRRLRLTQRANGRRIECSLATAIRGAFLSLKERSK